MNDIPGWFHGPHQTETIKLLWKYNYPGCVGVEVGCLHGRSSYAISVAINKGTLYCIDLWDGRDSYDPQFSDEMITKHKLPPKESYNIKQGEELYDWQITEMIRIVDAKRAEVNYGVSQFDINWELVDIEVREVFHRGLTTERLKCVAKFN